MPSASIFGEFSAGFAYCMVCLYWDFPIGRAYVEVCGNQDVDTWVMPHLCILVCSSLKCGECNLISGYSRNRGYLPNPFWGCDTFVGSWRDVQRAPDRHNSLRNCWQPGRMVLVAICASMGPECGNTGHSCGYPIDIQVGYRLTCPPVGVRTCPDEFQNIRNHCERVQVSCTHQQFIEVRFWCWGGFIRSNPTGFPIKKIGGRRTCIWLREWIWCCWWPFLLLLGLLW